MALVHTEMTSEHSAVDELQLSERALNPGLPLVVLGFPTPILSQDVIGQTNLDRLVKPHFLYNSDTDHGMSGSPVFDEEANLVGIHLGAAIDGKSNMALLLKLIREELAN